MSDYLVIGGGKQSEAIAYDILKFDLTSHVTVIDNVPHRLNGLHGRIKSDRLQTMIVDASSRSFMDRLIRDYDVIIGAASYKLYETIAELSARNGKKYLDLGGNNTVVEKIFTLDDLAKRTGASLMPDTGIAPGTASIATSYGMKLIQDPKYALILCGGLPQHPKGELGYMIVFSPEGWVNEIIERVEIIKNYKRTIVEPMSKLEIYAFDDPSLTGGTIMLEAARTSGGLSTMAKTYEGRLESLEYKTLRYLEHWPKMIEKYDRGYFRSDIFRDGKPVRKWSEEELAMECGYNDEDMLFFKVIVGNDDEEVVLQMIDYYDKNTGHTAMQRTTGYSAAIIAEMMANNVISEKGVLKLEESIPQELFFREFKKRGFKLEETRKYKKEKKRKKITIPSLTS